MLPVFPDLLSSSSVLRIFGPWFPEKQVLSVCGQGGPWGQSLSCGWRAGISGLKGDPCRLCQVQGEMVGGRPRGGVMDTGT